MVDILIVNFRSNFIITRINIFTIFINLCLYLISYIGHSILAYDVIFKENIISNNIYNLLIFTKKQINIILMSKYEY